VPADPPPWLTYEQRGSVLRVVGQHRGFIDTARNVGVQGEALDSLISEQRDFFTQRGEAVEWKTRGHDEPPDLPARLLAAGFVPEGRETVVIGRAEQMAVEPVLPDRVTLRQVHEPGDFARIAAMESEVWDDDFSWVAQDLKMRGGHMRRWPFGNWDGARSTRRETPGSQGRHTRSAPDTATKCRSRDWWPTFGCIII
jgi:hypothetical protein